MKYSFLFILIVLLSFKSSIQDRTDIKSGVYGYGKLRVAINEDGSRITGFYKNIIERSGTWDCRFYFRGVLKNDTFNISIGEINGSEFDPRVDGQIYRKGDNIMFTMDEAYDADCWRVLQAVEYAGREFMLDEEKKWTSIEIINEKSYFHSEPKNNSKLNSYVIKNDLIYILKGTNEWLLSEFYGSSTTKGWIKRNNIKK